MNLLLNTLHALESGKKAFTSASTTQTASATTTLNRPAPVMLHFGKQDTASTATRVPATTPHPHSKAGPLLEFPEEAPGIASIVCMSGRFLWIGFSRLRRNDTRTFLDEIEAVSGQVGQRLHLPIRPHDPRFIHVVMASQAEVNAQIVLRKIAAAADHFAKLHQVARDRLH